MKFHMIRTNNAVIDLFQENNESKVVIHNNTHPAIRYNNGEVEYWVLGRQYSKEDFHYGQERFKLQLQKEWDEIFNEIDSDIEDEDIVEIENIPLTEHKHIQTINNLNKKNKELEEQILQLQVQLKEKQDVIKEDPIKVHRWYKFITDSAKVAMTIHTDRKLFRGIVRDCDQNQVSIYTSNTYANLLTPYVFIDLDSIVAIELSSMPACHR